MRPEFQDIYADLLALYGRSPFPYDYDPDVWALLRRAPAIYPRPLGLLREAVLRGVRESEFRPRVRADAELFLLVNFGGLVLKPLLHPNAPSRRNPELLAADIQTDTTTIIRAAARETRRDPISAAETLRVLPRLYDSLKIKSMDLWG